MDIIALGKANLTLKRIKDMEEQIVAPLAESRFKTIDARLDWLEQQATNLSSLTDVFTDLTKGLSGQLEVDWRGFVTLKKTKTGKVIGETGRVDIGDSIDGGVEKQIKFRNYYADPIVIAFVNTNREPESIEARVKDVTKQGCTIFMEEPNGTIHASETVSYIVMDKGTHTLPSGIKIEAGRVDTSSVHRSPNAFGGEIISLTSGHFGSAPVILHGLQTHNNKDFMSSVAHSVNATSFMLQQEASNSGILGAIETIGWIALSAGSGKNNGVQFEIGTVDSDHTTKTLSFKNPFLMAPVFIAKGNTGNSPDGYFTRGLDIQTIQAQVHVREAGSDDVHVAETLGYVAIDELANISIEDHYYEPTGTWESIIDLSDGWIKTKLAEVKTYTESPKTTITIEIASSSDGINFSPFAPFDPAALPQTRFVKVKAVLTAETIQSLGGGFLFDQLNAQNTFTLGQYVLADGQLKLKTNYSYAMANNGALGAGTQFSVAIDKSLFKSIEKVEVK